MIKRVYHPYYSWEEYHHGMYSSIDNRSDWLKKAISFTSDHIQYGMYMRRVATEWPISCENALTDPSINKKAWIGHAACALAFNCPEDVVREAWGNLTDEQRLLANREADRAILLWRTNYEMSHGLRENMAGSLL